MIKAKCTNCEYEWDSSSKMFQVSCPSCGYKVKIRELKAEKKE
jgi:DNA-directed RNA polymerase subunit RPC12/RpoP